MLVVHERRLVAAMNYQENDPIWMVHNCDFLGSSYILTNAHSFDAIAGKVSKSLFRILTMS